MKNLRCCQTSLWCPLDNLLHILRINVSWVCDQHERVITGRL